jgi:hypothetical protein
VALTKALEAFPKRLQKFNGDKPVVICLLGLIFIQFFFQAVRIGTLNNAWLEVTNICQLTLNKKKHKN